MITDSHLVRQIGRMISKLVDRMVRRLVSRLVGTLVGKIPMGRPVEFATWSNTLIEWQRQQFFFTIIHFSMTALLIPPLYLATTSANKSVKH